MCLDLFKAFDRVDHFIFLQKLRQFGLGGSLLTMIASHLGNRVQHVTIGNSLSEELLITTGVPQGSMLKPLCVLILVNNLPEFSTCQLYRFTDDLTPKRFVVTTYVQQ